MKNIFLPLSILILIGLNSNSQSWNWLTPDGSPGNDVGKHLAIDASHNAAVAGVFNDTIFSGNNIQISRGGDDVFIAKYDSLGTLLWSRSGGGLSDDGEYSMGITFDTYGNIYVLCYVIGDVIFPPDTLQNLSGGILLLKYDGNGNHIFSKIFGGAGVDYATDVNVDPAGNVFCSGAFSGNVIFDTVQLSSSGSLDIFLAKFDSSGNTIWARKAGGGSYDNGGGINFDAFHNIYLTGYYTGLCYFDTILISGSGGDDCFIAKYDSSGNIQWVRKGTGIGQYDAGNRIGVDFQEKIYVVGQFSDTFRLGSQTLVSNGLQDVFIAKLDQQGNFLWVKNYGGPGDDIAFDMKAMIEGNHYVTGQFSGTANFDGHILTSAGGTDVFVFLSDLNGTIQWVKQAGGIGDDAGRGIDADNLYECFVTGSFSDAVTFDMINAASTGGTDLFTGRIFDPTLGINKTDKSDQIIFYPNPVSTSINIPVPIKKDAAYRIFNSQGSLVMEGLIRNQNSSIDVSRLSEGIYFLSINDSYFKFALIR